MPKVNRSVKSDDGKMMIHDVTWDKDQVMIVVTGKTDTNETKSVAVTMEIREFLDTVVAMWPDNVAYQFKDDAQ